MFRLQLQRIRYPLRPAGPSFGHPSGNSVITRALSTTGNNSKPPHAFQHALARLEQIRQTALKIASNAHAKERKNLDSQQRARPFNSHQTLQADKSHIILQNFNAAVSNQKESVSISSSTLSSSTSKNSRYVEKRTSSDEGQWVNDLMNGDMKITFPDGKIFTGTFHMNALVPGSGSFVHSHPSTLSVSTRRKHASFGPATDESVDRAALRTSVPLLGQAFEGVQQGSGVGLQKYPEGSVYEGETQGEKFHGQGTLTCPDGSSYSGHWAHDQRTLHGVATSTDGAVYTGEWAHDSMLGKGEIVYKSGDRLAGDFVFGVLYKGTGTIHGTDSVYVGDWDYGCMHGSGEYTKANGFAYTGEWKYGLRDGEGKQVCSDGSVYTGTFLQDVYHGSGKVVCADGATVEGTFVHGELCGKGVRILADGTVHRGIFQGDSMKGEIYYPDGKKFTGVVRALMPYSGKGTVRTASTTYTGEVERGEKHGSGAFTFPDGRVYQGMWQRGLMHGEGVLRCSAGSARGTFKQGRLHDGSGVMLVEGRKVWGKWVAGVHQKERVQGTEQPDKISVHANTIDENPHEQANDTLTATTSATTSTNNANITSTSSTSTSPLLNGPGTLTLPDGRTLTGTFVNSLIQGTGTMKDPVKRLTYTGMFHNNKPHGQGSLVCAKGSKWEGTFVEGFLHGFGARYVREGAHYTGMFRNAMYHGAGKSVIDDYVYEGEYEMGKKHGTGKLSVVGVFTFEGEWRHDKREGYGVNTNISNNTTYKGMYRDNLFHGEGCITNRHGTYSGAFERGERHGSGVFTANGVQVSGEWVNNRLHGVATITSTATSTGNSAAANTTSPNASTISSTSNTANATSHSVRGLFNHNILLYQVTSTDEPDRNVDKLWERLPAYKSTDLFAPERKFYIGETQDNLKHGYGRFVFADGRVYQGMWQRGLMHGEGVLRCSAGSARGEWREGQVYTAEGVMTDERGTVYEGKWENGVRTGPFKITFPSGVTLQTHGADGDEVFRKPRSKNNNSRSELRKAPSTDDATNNATTDTTSSADSEEVYTGDKKDGIPHGRGKLVRNGESWEGTFVHGEFTGVGIYRSIFSTSYNTGNYTTASGWGGKMISNSTSSNKVGIDKRGTVYVGHFANFMFCGKGKLHTDGKIYEGTFLENRLHGYGKCIDEIGIYEGEWAQGRRHGAGTLVQEGGNSIVDGVWFNNMLQRTASRPFVK